MNPCSRKKLCETSADHGKAMEVMVSSLQNILKYERTHFNFYLQSLMVIKGVERLYLKPFFEKEMLSELEHVRLFGDKIVALGHSPTLDSFPISLSTNPTAREMLEKAIILERAILEVYHAVYPGAELFNELFSDMSIVLLLEENIEHTTADVEEMEKMLENI